jgi:hypothetical protein
MDACALAVAPNESFRSNPSTPFVPESSHPDSIMLHN